MAKDEDSKKTTPADDVRLQVNAAIDTAGRAMWSQLAGMQFAGDRDIDTNLGYEKDPSLEQYQSYYDRRDLASVIVDAPAQTTWRENPIITDGSEGKSKFIAGWNELESRLKAYSYMERADRLSGIGHYGVLLIGTKDGELSEPLLKVGSAQDVIYLSTYSESYAKVKTYETDTSNPRFGRPKVYEIDLKGNVATGFDVGKQDVHYSRIIHIAEGLLENEVFGEPRLQKVYNRLQDMDKVVGPSAEAYWKLVFKGYALSTKEGYEMDPADKEAIKEEWQNYIHNFQRLIAAEGVDFDALTAKPEDPGPVFDVIIKLISGKTRIPQRVLLGSERGELASSQDEANWLGYISGRQKNFAQPFILEALIDRLVDIGAIEAAKDGIYKVEWPSLFYINAKEEAEVHERNANAIDKVSAGAPLDLFDEEELRIAVGAPPERKGTAFTVNVLDEDDPEVQAVFERFQNAHNR